MQEWENQECIKYMSEVLTEWHRKRFNRPKKCWYEGDRCVALRSSDLMFHRAEIQQVYVKQQKCLVKRKLFHILFNQQENVQQMFINDSFNSNLISGSMG